MMVSPCNFRRMPEALLGHEWVRSEFILDEFLEKLVRKLGFPEPSQDRARLRDRAQEQAAPVPQGWQFHRLPTPHVHPCQNRGSGNQVGRGLDDVGGTRTPLWRAKG